MTRTATPKTCGYAVHAFVRLHLSNEHVARFGHALPSFWRLVQRNRTTVAGGCGDACYGQRLTIQDYERPFPEKEKRVSSRPFDAQLLQPVPIMAEHVLVTL